MKRFMLYLTITVMIVTFGMPAAKALAIDETFYSLNDIIFFDPDSCSVGAGEGDSNGLVGSDNIEKSLRYFVGKGLTLSQASGILGNFGAESGLNPAIIQGGDIAPDDYSPVNGVGFGIAQWTWTSRQQPLVDLGQSTNRKITDLGLQLDYAWQELNSTHSFALTSLKASTTPDNAAYVFHRDFEGSADTEEMVKKNRGGGALNVYNQYKTIIPDGTPGSTNTNQVCTGNGQASEFVDGFAIYDQNDPQWADISYGNQGTVASAGCGPSAMAMIITALTKKTVTPKDTAEYGKTSTPSTVYEENGLAAGSLHNIHQVFGDKWGLKYTYLGKDVAKINEGLRSGGLVIIAGSGSAPFTDLGHFVVIRGVTATNQWLVGDSNGKAGIENSKKEWDPAYILSMSQSGYVWLMSK